MDKTVKGGVSKKERCHLTSLFDANGSVTVLGAALFYAWNLYSIYCESVISSATSDMVPHLSIFVNSFAATAGFVAIACFFFKMKSFYTIGLVVAAATGLATPTGLLAVHLFACDPAIVRTVVEAVSRIGSSWVIVSWGSRFAHLSPFAITVNILSTFAVALVMCLVIMFCPYAVRATFVSLALPGSMALLAVSQHAHDTTAQSAGPQHTKICSETFLSLTWRVILVFFLFGIVTWITLVSNRAGSEDSFSLSVAVIVGSMAVVLPLLATSLYRRGSLTKSYTYKVVLPLIMSGVLLTSIASSDTAFSWPLISIGYTCFDLFCFALYADACRRTGANALRAFGWCRAIEAAAPLAALGIMALFSPSAGESETFFMDLVVPAAIFAVVAMIALDRDNLFESDYAGSQTVYPQAEVLFFARQCQKVIEHYALSPREAEILSLVTRGRSVPHIAHRLSISNSTAKTHVSHIYEKLSVCDRQEMIDLIESMGLEDTPKA